jgi:hypothetical protein
MNVQRYRPRRPGALKHGVYSATAVLPGEDVEEFRQLLKSLREEWRPRGETEEDAVRTLAELLWRKNRLDIFDHMQLAKREYDIAHKVMGDLMIVARDYMGKPEEFRRHIKQRFLSTIGDPRSQEEIMILVNVLKRSEMFKAVPLLTEEVDRLLDATFDGLGVPDKDRIAWRNRAQENAWVCLADVITLEQFEKEVGVRERVQSMIERSINLLTQIKARKRMLDLDSQKALPRPQGDRAPRSERWSIPRSRVRKAS